MRLYSVSFFIFNHHNPIETEIPALSPELAYKKVENLVNQGKLFVTTSTIVTNAHGHEEQHIIKTRISGLITHGEVTELAHMPKRHWDEKKNNGQGGWNYNNPKHSDDPLHYTGKGRTIAADTRKTHDYDLHDLKNYSQGWQAASRDFSSKAKSHENKLKTALKAFNPTEFPRNIYAFQDGYVHQWKRLTALLLNKTTTKKRKTITKKTKKIAS